MKKGKKTALAALVIGSLAFASASYADCPQRGNYCDGPQKSCGYKKSSHRSKGERFFMGALYSLELSDTQKDAVSKIMQEFRSKRKSDMTAAFTKEGFDKEKYIQAKKDARDKMIESRAEMIEKIYGVLDAKQKAELKEELDDFYKNRKSRGYGKYCYGRG